jgi:biopolymer transport protein ExbD
MKIRKRSRFAAEVSTSSLNDIMFFLLLFFLIISTMANPNVIKLLLPKSKSTQQINQEQIVVNVTADKQYYVDKEPVANLDALKAKIQTLAAEKSAQNPNAQPVVLIRADRDLKIQDLVDIMAIGVELKLKMVLGAEKNG